MAGKIKLTLSCLALHLVICGFADRAYSQDAAVSNEQRKGKVTGLPIPRYVSMKASSGVARKGSHPDYAILWEFKESGIPFRVLDEDGSYRLVETMDGVGGWVEYKILTGSRTVIVAKEEATLHARAHADARIVAIAKRLVIGDLLKCNQDWCEIEAYGYKGWVSKSDIWGVDIEEIVE